MKENNGLFTVKRLLRKVFPAVAALFCTVILSACGATVNTTLDANADFKGTRTITAVLSSGDLNEYVKGGADSIEKVVKKYIPDNVEYKKKLDENSLTYTFTFSFNDLDDYRDKVDKIINSRREKEVAPEITYENLDNPFRKEVYLKENFNSIDLIYWLKYGLKKENVVNRDSDSDWFESGSSKIIIDGKEYDSSDKLKVDKTETNSPDRVDVITYINANGTVDRDFRFRFSANAMQKFAENSVDLDNYFGTLSAGAAVEKQEDESGTTTFDVKVSGIAPESVNAATAEIMHDDAAAFTFGVSGYTPAGTEDKDAYDVKFKISELVSGSYYTKNTIYCNYYFPGNVDNIEDEDTNTYTYYGTDNDDKTYYYFENRALEDGAAHILCYGWKVSFDKVSAELAFSGDKPELAVNMYIPADLMEAAKTPVKTKIEKAMPEGATFDESQSEDGAYTVFKADMKVGTSEDVATRYKQFIYNYSGLKTECSFSFEKGHSGSPFVTFCAYNAVFDMSGLSGGQPVSIVYNKTPGEKIFITENCSFIADPEQTDDGVYTGTSDSRVRFCAVTESVNIVGIIVCVIIVLSAIVLIIIAAANAKSWIALAKTAAAAAPKVSMPSVPSVPSAPAASTGAPKAAPVEKASIAEENTAASADSNDEEEFI